MTVPFHVPDAGDLIWTDFDPSPALVISAAAFTAATGLVVVCPIASKIRPFPTSVVLPDGLPVAGEILLSHVRSLDILARPIRPAGAAIPTATRLLVRAKLAAFVTI